MDDMSVLYRLNLKVFFKFIVSVDIDWFVLHFFSL